MRVAIMQPTYLPWMGYFAMMERVDKFIYLDTVQFSKRSWQQRNRIKTLQGELLLTIPVQNKGMREQLIRETKIDISSNFAEKHWRSIENAYRQSPFFFEYSQLIKNCYLTPQCHLVDFNIGIIETLCGILRIKTPRMRSSRMSGGGNKADLLASLCVEAKAETYVSAPGSRDYINRSSAFQDAGIIVEYFDFEHPPYQQSKGAFLPYMSIIDLLFNVGAEEAQALLHQSKS